MTKKQIMKKISKFTQDTAVGGAIGTVDLVVVRYPALLPAWGLAKGFLGAVLSQRSDRAIEWVEGIINNPDIFTDQILATEEFKDGFVVALEQYVKLRSADKRRFAAAVFLGFTSATDKEAFPLERYSDTLAKISNSSLNFLRLIDSVILPYKIDQIQKDMKSQNLGDEKPYEWWFDLNMQREPVAKYFSLWVTDNYSPNSPKVIEEYGINGKIPKEKLQQLFDIEKAERDKYSKPIAELLYLGILNSIATYDSVGGTSWTLSEFGTDFMQYLKTK